MKTFKVRKRPTKRKIAKVQMELIRMINEIIKISNKAALNEK